MGHSNSVWLSAQLTQSYKERGFWKAHTHTALAQIPPAQGSLDKHAVCAARAKLFFLCLVFFNLGFITIIWTSEWL